MGSRYEIHLSAGGGGSGPPPPGSVDHFAPKYLIGNIPNGDDAVPYNTAGFMYIPDPGDGMGIALALTQPNGPGDLWIRPGTYNFNLGAVVSPLAIPPSVRVYGSGDTTIVIGRSTLNQGIFTLSTLSQLREMRLLVLASDAGSLGSDAMVRVSGQGAILQNLQVVLTTAIGGQLREGIRFDTPFTSLASDMLNVGVSVATLTGGASPTRCIAILNNAFTFARHVQTLGGDEGVYSEQGIFVCKDLLAIGWSLFGIRHVGNGGAVRIDEALSQAGFGSVGGFCISLEGTGEHVLRSVAVQNNGSAGSRGISVVPLLGDLISPVEIDDCEISSVAIGIQLGDPLAGYVSDISVVNTAILNAFEYGIVIGNTLSSLCHLKGNRVETFITGAFGGGGVWVQGLRHEVEGNHVTHNNPNLNSQAVLLECTRTTFRGNTIEFSDAIGLVGIDVRLAIGDNEFTSSFAAGASTSILLKDGADHSTVGDNTIQQLSDGGGTPAITIDASLCTIGDNTIEVTLGAPVAPGILLNGDNNTCVANVVEGSTAPVSNVGVGNEVAHNVGV